MIDPEVWAALISVAGTLILRDGLPRLYKWNRARITRNTEHDQLQIDNVHQKAINAQINLGDNDDTV